MMARYPGEEMEMAEARQTLADRVVMLEKRMAGLLETIEELNASVRQHAHELGLDGRLR